MGGTELETAIVDIVSYKEPTDALANIGEAMLDDGLAEGVLRDVPLIGTVVGLIRAGATVREHLFLKKLARFAAELGDISDEERAEFRDEMDRDPEFREEVGENLLLLLERAAEVQKPRLIGKLFAAYLRKRISHSQMQRAVVAVDRAHYADLIQLAENDGRITDEGLGAELAHAGLMSARVTTFYGGSVVSYVLSETGRQVLDICFPHYSQRGASEPSA